jgi:hypothetical protein
LGATGASLEVAVRKGLGRTGLMMFMELDHGAILRKETGLDTPKIVRFVIGNPLIMKEMAKPCSRQIPVIPLHKQLRVRQH